MSNELNSKVTVREHRSCARIFLAAAGLLVMGLAFVGCKQIDVARWSEDVQLHDGRVIRVDRVAKAYRSGFPAARRGANIEYELSYEPLGVHWRGEAPGTLMSFEIFDGVPYLVLYADGRTVCPGAEEGRYKAVFLKWQSGQWQEISQSAYPLTDALKNMYEGYWGYSPAQDARGHITWAQKAKNDGFNASKPYTVRSWLELSHRICKHN